MKSIERFFCYCAGASLSLLKRCPTEVSKFAGIGAAVFFTGLLAAISSAYALHFVFDGIILPTMFGLIWGLMIFNLDRLIVLSMRKAHVGNREFYQAVPRILLAVFIALVISKPLELKIFEKEIATELGLIRQELFLANERAVQTRYQARTDSLKSEIVAMEEAIGRKEQSRDELLNLARQEADGTGGSGKVNPGPIYQIKKKNADQAQHELNELRVSNGLLIDKVRNELEETEQFMNNELAQVEVTNINGVSFQLTALERLGKKYPSVFYANVFIVLLFIMLEIAPIIGKLLTPRGPYDDLLEVHEKRFESYRKEKVHKEDKRVEEYMMPQTS